MRLAPDPGCHKPVTREGALEPKAGMESSAVSSLAVEAPAPGRPTEIEDPSNLYLIHPMSRAVAGWLVPTPVTPNMVSVSSVAFAAGGAASYLWLAPPWGAFAGLALMIVWHVLDGADGDLARRTGRASPIGELVDGVCDHASQACLYVAFAVMAVPALGGWAWGLAVGAALSHFVQSNAYESSRKTYRRWVYGARWMRQDAEGASGLRGLLSGLYLGVSGLTSPGETAVEAAMAGREADPAARALYKDRFAPVVKRAGWLGGNGRTAAGFLAVLASHPAWFFVFELTVLNAVLAAVTIWRGSRNKALAQALAAETRNPPA
jgi:phosphatidylglycerophosphate synthase